MTKLDVNSIIIELIENCREIEKATLGGDYRANNKYGRKNLRIYRTISENISDGINILYKLLENDNVVVRTLAAAYCLGLKVNVCQAENVLVEAANDEANGIFGFNAEMTMQVWKEQGYLKFER